MYDISVAYSYSVNQMGQFAVFVLCHWKLIEIQLEVEGGLIAKMSLHN